MSWYTVRPLSAVAATKMTGKGTEHSPFRSTWTATETLLRREINALRGRDVIIQVNCLESELRLDGQLRANARPATPHAAVSFDSASKGPLLFCCGRYRTWQDNVRGIALGLEALRKIDRYGIIQSDEQYTGFRALPAGSTEWVSTLAAYSGWSYEDVLADPDGAYKAAVKKAHPDQGGSRASFEEVRRARDQIPT